MATDESRSSDERSGAVLPGKPPQMVFEIHRADGDKAEQLRREQTSVIREVVEWLAQMRSGPGQDRAA
jgi:hypothetical protein